jgi:hypothetical protein
MLGRWKSLVGAARVEVFGVSVMVQSPRIIAMNVGYARLGMRPP